MIEKMKLPKVQKNAQKCKMTVMNAGPMSI